MTLPAGAHDVEDLTRKDISFGLPKETESLTTVEVYDSDNNGRDEIYLSGSGFDDAPAPNDDYVKTEGILVYEYNPDSSRWEQFGNGLPGEGSGLSFGALGIGDIDDDGKLDIAAPVPKDGMKIWGVKRKVCISIQVMDLVTIIISIRFP